MAAKLIVRKESGEELFDTTKISYGLVKSGYLTYAETWNRYIKPFINTDPDLASSWVLAANLVDNMYGFSVENTKCPIAFIVGPGCLNGTKVSGNTKTFLYANATTSTKFYCFDLMSDNIAGGPYLKTWNEDGEITFNSLQLPLDISDTVQAPGAPGLAWGNYRSGPYIGGVGYETTSGNTPNYHYRADIPLTAGIEYAACLPWSRACRVFSFFSGQSLRYFSLSEGAYGRVGGMSFMFGAAGATTEDRYTQTPGRPNPLIDLLPTDRYPQALVISTSTYPFPFG